MSQKYLFPEWVRNKTIYEVNLRQYTPSGTIAEFRTHLPRLKALGAGILWLMPVQPVGEKCRKGSLGSYYSISNYHEVNPEFGNIHDFIDLVHEIHSLGMYVILDWVANHTAWDHHWTKDHPEFYRRNELNEVFPPFPEWEDVIGLDYQNPALRKAMISEMKFWLTETGIDGFRCDMAMLVPTDFWNSVRAELEGIKPVFMLAEAEQRDLTEEAFDVLYNWNLHHVFNDLACGKYNAHEIRWRLPSEIGDFPKGCDNLLFISNHDENTWNGTELERLNYALEAIAVLMFTLPGIPLIYSGMEAGNYKRLAFFDKDCIDWKVDKMAVLYSKLAHLRENNIAMWSMQPKEDFILLTTTSDAQILAFKRETSNHRVVVIINLSASPVAFSLTGDGYQGDYVDVIHELEVKVHDSPCLSLPPWGYRVWAKK